MIVHGVVITGADETRFREMQALESQVSEQIGILKSGHATMMAEHKELCAKCASGTPCSGALDAERDYRKNHVRLVYRQIAAIREQAHVLTMTMCGKRNSSCALHEKHIPDCVSLGKCKLRKSFDQPFVDRILRLRREELGEKIPKEASDYQVVMSKPLLIQHA